MHIHIPDKGKNENILKANPVTTNVKTRQVLDNCIKNLLTKKKGHLHQHMKSPCRLCRKRCYIFWGHFDDCLIMENEKLSSSGYRDKEVQEITAISSLFEQTMSSIGQVFHSVTYYCRGNILSTLIDNPSKVKEILKDSDIMQDNISNTHLFCDKFEGKLLKNTNAKQKSKLIFKTNSS